MHTQLTKLIGQRFLFRGKVWLIVEILREEDALVIAPEQAAKNQRIQADQYGNATRRCDHCKTLPLSNPDNSDEYSADVMELLAGRIGDASTPSE
ncbi:hypothetical protein [Thiolapillus sp.]